jgi:hypothetical protein
LYAAGKQMRKQVKRVPKGTSEYQAAWIFDSDHSDESDVSRLITFYRLPLYNKSAMMSIFNFFNNELTRLISFFIIEMYRE